MHENTAKNHHTETIEIDDGSEIWRFDRAFFSSRWKCIWDCGCMGIEAYDATTQRTGCCSVGVELVDEDEAMLIAALAACIDPVRFSNFEVAQRDTIFASDERRFTRVVEKACVFFNPVDSSAPTGCALHVEAEAQGENPADWKPAVCSQVPIRVDTETMDGRSTHRVRAWTREDWGDDGRDMYWWCTEPNTDGHLADAYIEETPVAVRLQAEIAAVAGADVAAELTSRIQSP